MTRHPCVHTPDAARRRLQLLCVDWESEFPPGSTAIRFSSEEDTMFCPQCGAKNDQDSRHCSQCGTALGEPVPTPPQMPQQPPPGVQPYYPPPPNAPGVPVVGATVPNYMTQAIIVTLFCCIPLGIVGHHARERSQQAACGGRLRGRSCGFKQRTVHVLVGSWFGTGLQHPVCDAPARKVLKPTCASQRIAA